AVPVGPARRRQGRAAGRARTQELGRAPLGRRARARGPVLSAMQRIRLPRGDGSLHDYTMRAAAVWTPPPPGTRFNRVAYAAAHVVADPLSTDDPGLETASEW